MGLYGQYLECIITMYNKAKLTKCHTQFALRMCAVVLLMNALTAEVFVRLLQLYNR